MRTYIIRFLPVVTAITVISSLARASLLQPADGPYSSVVGPGTSFIFERHSVDVVGDIAALVAAVRRDYDRSFAWRLDETADYILASPNQQFGNAFADIAPNLKTFWWPSGAADLERDATPSWAAQIAIHETAHLYQLNAKGWFNARAKRVFGSAVATNAAGFPLIIHPNKMLPRSLLEGNAVMNESRFGIGGRLFSGEVRALALRLVAEGQVDASRLINSQFRYPFGESAYILGGYFQAHLATKYGADRTNAYFVAQGDRWLNPLLINRTFKAHFGSSFYAEVHEFTRGMERLAAAQVLASGPALDRGIVVSPLNHDERRVWWMSSPGYRTPSINVYDKQTGRHSARALDLPMPTIPLKVFSRGNDWAAAATLQRDLHHQTYSLYGENARYMPDFANQIVTDQRAGKTVAIDPGRSWLNYQILHDGVPFDTGNSNPILDEAGHVYYFRQHGDRRLLYRDHQVVNSVTGYYAKMTEVDERGRVYFIGATPTGATLYRFTPGGIERMVTSDAVTDARVIDDDHVLVTEATGTGPRVLVTDARAEVATPAVYGYAFAAEPLRPETAASITATDIRKYGGWRRLRFAGSDFRTTYDFNLGLNVRAQADFADPLQYHELTISGYLGDGPRGGGFEYHYDRYLFKPNLAYAYRRETFAVGRSRLDVVDHEIDLGFDLGLYQRGRWRANVNASALYAREHTDPNSFGVGRTYGAFSKWSAVRHVPTLNGLYPWRRQAFGVGHRMTREDVTGARDEHAGSVEYGFDHGFDGEYYLGAEAQVAAATDRQIEVGYAPGSFATRVAVPRLNGSRSRVREAARIRLEGRRVFNLPRYDARIPLGLNRIGLVLVGQGLATSNAGGRFNADGPEVAVGLDVDGLVFHFFPFRTRVLTGVQGRGDLDRTFTQVSFSGQRTF